MPTPIDLAGRRFGALIAVSPARTPSGQRAWLCTCDCGTETVVPVQRLSSASDDDPRAIRACETCRSRRCAVCGALYLRAGSSATCGAPACRGAHRRATNSQIAARAEIREPGYKARCNATWRAKMRSSRSALAAWRERDREYKRAIRQAITPEQREAARIRAREYYAARRDEIQAAFRAWVDSLPPDRRASWDARRAESARQYKRRAALGKMLREAQQMTDMIEEIENGR